MNIPQFSNLRGRNPIVMAHSTLVGKIIHFAGRKKGQPGIVSEKGLCIKVVIGRRKGPIYHTANGFRVPETLITSVEASEAADKAINDFAQKQDDLQRIMRGLFGRQVTWFSRKRNREFTGTVTKLGKTRVQVEGTGDGLIWKVPPSLIKKVNGFPFTM